MLQRQFSYCLHSTFIVCEDVARDSYDEDEEEDEEEEAEEEDMMESTKDRDQLIEKYRVSCSQTDVLFELMMWCNH